jgi:hypothetical protein
MADVGKGGRAGGARKRPPRPGEGRPTALTQKVQNEIIRFVRLGNYIETAAAVAGVARSTVFDWLRRGAREGAGPYWEFSVAVRKAQAEAEATDLACVQLAARKDWRAAAWRLQHRFPSHWGGARALAPEGDWDGAEEDVEPASEAPEIAPERFTEEDYAAAAHFLLERRRNARLAERQQRAEARGDERH